MKCEFCGATLPDPPRAPTYTESYKELRETIGKLEYDNSVLSDEKKKIEGWIIGSRENMEKAQGAEKSIRKSKRLWKAFAIILIATNCFWFLVMIASL